MLDQPVAQRTCSLGLKVMDDAFQRLEGVEKIDFLAPPPPLQDHAAGRGSADPETRRTPPPSQDLWLEPLSQRGVLPRHTSRGSITATMELRAYTASIRPGDANDRKERPALGWL
jgi:hypothetical protein